MAESRRDQNSIPSLLGASNVDGQTPVTVYVDPITHELLVKLAATSLPTGAATSAKQDSQITLETTLNSLTETLQELAQRLAPLAGAMNNTAQLRAVVTGAVTATGGGYITSANSIAEKAVAGILYPEKVAVTNLTAIQSNIINCTGV